MNYSVCQRVRTSSNTCSTTIPAKSRKISFRSEMDCTICRISLSRSSTMTVFCSTSISWSSVNPWKERRRCYYSTTITPTQAASADTTQTTVHLMVKLRRKGKQVQIQNSFNHIRKCGFLWADRPSCFMSFILPLSRAVSGKNTSIHMSVLHKLYQGYGFKPSEWT